MWDKRKSKYIDDEVTIESLISEDELEMLEILNEETGEIDEEIEIYDGYIRLIGYSVSLSHTILKTFEAQSEKLNTSMKRNNDSLKEKMKDTLAQGIKCNIMVSKYIMGIYEHCEKIERYWHNSSLELYKKYYPHLLEAYLTKFKNSTNLDFLKCEYEFFLRINSDNKKISPAQNCVNENDDLGAIGYFRCLNVDEQEFFKIETQKKLDFISNKILELGYYVQVAKLKKRIIINLIPEKQNDFDKLEEEILDISQLPKFNLIERYELLEKLGLNSLVSSIESDKKSLNKILALILGCSVVNARKLIDGTYKVKNSSQKKERQKEIDLKIKDFLINNNIKIKNIKS